MYENILTEFGFMEEFDVVFKNHEIVQNSNRLYKSRFEKSKKIPEYSNISTRKRNKLNSYNTTRKMYK